jgi:hypothetical protein
VLSLDDADASRAAAERAFREYLDRDDARSAARLATTLAMHHETYRGESAIASGWFEPPAVARREALNAEADQRRPPRGTFACPVRGKLGRVSPHARKCSARR